MILKIDGDLNPYYAQTLCLIYFPGEKFGAAEAGRADAPRADILVREREDGVYSSVQLCCGDKKGFGENFVAYSELFPRGRVKKIASGHAMTLAAKELFGYISPWGVLTGVRPAKVAAQYLVNGLGVMKTRKLLAGEYFLNPKKAFLATSVAQTELRLTRGLPDNLCSVYISVPFCPTRCAYCSFVSASHKMLSLLDDYLVRLVEDVRRTFALIEKLGLSPASVYIGGGTPTTLDARQLETLLSSVAESTDISKLMEFTLEAGRPDTITCEKLAAAKRYGVTRISVNPQSLSDGVLQTIGRRHTVEDFYRAYEQAASCGIREINTDLIVGLPGDDFKTFSLSLDKIISLAPANITVHAFCFKRAADMSRPAGALYSPDAQTAAKCIQYSQLTLANAAYKPYYMYRQKNAVGNLENVGFSTAGHECMYNIFMMEEMHSIFGVGAGAVTKLVQSGLSGTENRIRRIFAPKYPYEYLRDIEKIRCGIPARGVPSYEERVFEFFRGE